MQGWQCSVSINHSDPVTFAGAVVVYTGDCLPSIQSLQSMSSSIPEVFSEIKQLYTFAAEHDVHVDFDWEPRETETMKYADMLSRIEDSSELFLTRSAFRRIVLRSFDGGTWGMPTLDCFAGGARGQHKADRYYTAYYTVDTCGVNAMLQHWAVDAQVPGRHALLWVFPPFHLIGSVIHKLLQERVDAILIVPKFIRHWTAMLAHLPVVDVYELSYHVGLYTIGSRAPVSMQKNLPRYPLTAYLLGFAS